MNTRSVVDTVDLMLPEGKGSNRSALMRHKMTVMVGCATELPKIRPSYPELAEVIGCSHSMCIKYREYWYEMPWRDRHAWLQLVEGKLFDETNTVDAAVL